MTPIESAKSGRLPEKTGDHGYLFHDRLWIATQNSHTCLDESGPLQQSQLTSIAKLKKLGVVDLWHGALSCGEILSSPPINSTKFKLIGVNQRPKYKDPKSNLDMGSKNGDRIRCFIRSGGIMQVVSLIEA
jgi:hypothetical protein